MGSLKTWSLAVRATLGATAAEAGPITFTYTGSIQQYAGATAGI